MGSEEGGRRREGEKRREAGRTGPFGGQVGRDARPSTKQKQDIHPVPPPPFTTPKFALERTVRGLTSALSVVMNTEMKGKDEEEVG
jgi:hypothetical protein